MTQKLYDFLKEYENKNFSTNIGTQMHTVLQHVIVDDSGDKGDSNIVNIIKSRNDLKPFFVAHAQTEVPIAGKVHGQFVSRRIDRLLINKANKTINFIDYKTDSDKTAFVDNYKHQLKEYTELLHSAYPDFKINGYILWLHDWTLDKII